MNKTLDLKYRPSTYEEVVGQDEAINSLKGDLIKSYVFTGPSGSGKTSLSRIFAKSYNAEILEQDSASLGKSDIETLKENAYYKPMFNKEKFVILDEVHNLSKQAWDSLLKVIEEGPSFVVWLLLTTEPEKVPPTIRTRSRIVQFKNIPLNVITKQLEYICEQEGVTLEKEVLHNIAAYANGSLREAIKAVETYIQTGDLSVKNYQKSSIQLLNAVYNQDYDKIQELMLDFTATDLELLIRVITDYITMLLLLTTSKERANENNNVGYNILRDRTSINPDLIDDLRNLQANILRNFELIGNRHIEITVNTLYELMSTLMYNYNKFQDVTINVKGVLMWFSQKL